MPNVITIGDLSKAARKLHARLDFNGLKVSIENRKGSYRHWKDLHNGASGKTLMKFSYGYIRGSIGSDGDHVDCYIGPDKSATHVFIIDQMKAPAFKDFDEQKTMLAFTDADAAKKAYIGQYDNPRFFGSMKAMPFEEFRRKVLSTSQSKPMVKGFVAKPSEHFRVMCKKCNSVLAQCRCSTCKRTVSHRDSCPDCDKKRFVKKSSDKVINAQQRFVMRKINATTERARTEGQYETPVVNSTGSTEMTREQLKEIIDTIPDDDDQNWMGELLDKVQRGDSGLPDRPKLYLIKGERRKMPGHDPAPDLSKAGPYIGPRGGKWADAKHTIPWTAEHAKRGGARTGAVKIDDKKVHATIEELTRAVEGQADEFGMGPQTLHDTAGIEVIKDVVVSLVTSRETKGFSGVDYRATISTPGAKAPEKTSHSVILRAPQQFDDLVSYKRQLRSVLAHELTHVADPALSGVREQRDRARDVGYDKYLNQPHEVTAHLGQLRRDLLQPSAYTRLRRDLKRGDTVKPEEWAFEHSVIYRNVFYKLNDKNRKRMLRVVADLFTGIKEGTLEQVKKAKPHLFIKGGLYVGPRGGKWQDSRHKIPYRDLSERRRAKIPGTRAKAIDQLNKKIKRDPGNGHEVRLTSWELQHLLKEGKYALVSAGPNPKIEADKNLTREQIKARHEKLRERLKQSGCMFTSTVGHYEEREDSFLVMAHGAERSEVINWGKEFNQDSVIFAERGKNQLIYTSGEKADKNLHVAGKGWEPKAGAQGDYTVVKHSDGGETKFALNLDFGKEIELSKALRFFIKAGMHKYKRRWKDAKGKWRYEYPKTKGVTYSSAWDREMNTPRNNQHYAGPIREDMNLSEAEVAIAKETIEHCAIFGSGGEQLWRQHGSEHAIAIRPVESAWWHANGDCVFTHNHPSAHCFSQDDINYAVRTNLKEMRAVTNAGVTYVLSRPETGWGVPDVDLREGGGFRAFINHVHHTGVLQAYAKMDQYILKRGGTPGNENDPHFSQEVWDDYAAEETYRAFKRYFGEEYGWNVRRLKAKASKARTEKSGVAEHERYFIKTDRARPQSSGHPVRVASGVAAKIVTIDELSSLIKANKPGGKGWQAIPAGRRGGLRRKTGKGYEYWYPTGKAVSKPSRAAAKPARPAVPEDAVRIPKFRESKAAKGTVLSKMEGGKYFETTAEHYRLNPEGVPVKKERRVLTVPDDEKIQLIEEFAPMIKKVARTNARRFALPQQKETFDELQSAATEGFLASIDSYEGGMSFALHSKFLSDQYTRLHAAREFAGGIAMSRRHARMFTSFIAARAEAARVNKTDAPTLEQTAQRWEITKRDVHEGLQHNRGQLLPMEPYSIRAGGIVGGKDNPGKLKWAEHFAKFLDGQATAEGSDYLETNLPSEQGFGTGGDDLSDQDRIIIRHDLNRVLDKLTDYRTRVGKMEYRTNAAEIIRKTMGLDGPAKSLQAVALEVPVERAVAGVDKKGKPTTSYVPLQHRAAQTAMARIFEDTLRTLRSELSSDYARGLVERTATARVVESRKIAPGPTWGQLLQARAKALTRADVGVWREKIRGVLRQTIATAERDGDTERAARFRSVLQRVNEIGLRKARILAAEYEVRTRPGNRRWFRSAEALAVELPQEGRHRPVEVIRTDPDTGELEKVVLGSYDDFRKAETDVTLPDMGAVSFAAHFPKLARVLFGSNDDGVPTLEREVALELIGVL